MKKEKRPRNPWKIAAITVMCLIGGLVLFYFVALGAFSGLFVRPSVDPPDILGGSWGQINQPIEKPANWRRIVEDKHGDFVLGEAPTTIIGGTYPTIDGSTVMVPLAMEFARQHLAIMADNVLANLTEFSTTDAAYEKLFDPDGLEAGYGRTEQGQLELRSTGRPLDLFLGTLYSQEELALAERNGVTPVAKPICKDAFVFITHRDNPVESLTLEQARGIFSGAITNWKDVGGADEAIRAFQREPGSGSQTGMEQLVMRGTPMAPAEKVKVLWGMGSLVEAVAEYRNTPAGIGYTYKFYIDNLYKNPDIKILRIEGMAPTDGTIIDETYPLSVNYYGVIRAGDEQAPGGLFLDWILSEEGQACVRQAGYTPIDN
ncbi:MAG: substrate-binding domain-containing protein [Oscillospiraceae bacterium]|jgi:phosphate transport system substrate-binding protein|nr:substrate-binding domain-containing protein [Oscillospiraceae bacterium]